MYNWDAVRDSAMEPSKTGTDVYQPRNPRASDYFRSVEGTLSSWRGSAMIAMQADTAFGVPIRWMWFAAIWIVGIYITVLPG